MKKVVFGKKSRPRSSHNGRVTRLPETGFTVASEGEVLVTRTSRRLPAPDPLGAVLERIARLDRRDSPPSPRL